MRRVGLVAALAALAAVGIVGVLAWPSSSGVEAGPFPSAASQLRQLWATAPTTHDRLPFNVSEGMGVPERPPGPRLVVDTRLARGKRLALYVWQRPNGEVCDADSLGGAACRRSLDGVPGAYSTTSSHGANLLSGFLADGTVGADFEILGRWQPVHVSGRGIYLDFGRFNKSSAIGAVRWHLADGSTVTCDRWATC